MQFNRTFIISFVFICCTIVLTAQETWSLEKCIEYAIQHQPNIAQSNLDIRIAEYNLQEQNRRRLPTVDANASLGVQLGRTIDPTTNSFDNQQIGYNGLRLNAEWIVFSGGRTITAIAQRKQLLESMQGVRAVAVFQLKLDVLSAYLSVLLANEQLEQNRVSQKTLEDQLRNLEKQVAAGTRSVTQRLEIQAQIAQRQQAVTQSQYQLDLAYAILKNTMFMTESEDFQIERTAPAINKVQNLADATIYQKVQAQHPLVQQQNANLRAAEYSIRLAQSGFYPTIGFFGSLNSNYSTVAKQIDRVETIIAQEEVVFNGMNGLLETEGQRIIRSNQPYFSQISENFGQQVGLFISVPIYNQGLNKLNIERAKVELIRSKSNYDQQKQQLHFAVEQALIDIKAAERIYESAVENVAINQRLLQNKEREWRLGAIPQVEYFIVRNNLEAAEIQLIQAKYDHFFKSKLLEWYWEGDYE